MTNIMSISLANEYGTKATVGFLPATRINVPPFSDAAYRRAAKQAYPARRRNF